VIPFIATAFALGLSLGFAIGVISARRYVEKIMKSCGDCHYQKYLREFKQDMLGSSDERVAAFFRENIRTKRAALDALRKKPADPQKP
jgi:hypothetical protein